MEVRWAIGILRWDGGVSIRNTRIILEKMVGVRVSIGFICKELRETAKRAQSINEKLRNVIKLTHCVADEVWIRVATVTKKWTYGFLLASPKSLFIWALDYMTRRDGTAMGFKVMEYQEKGLKPEVFISDLLKTYRCISGYFKGCLHQLCKVHGVRALYRVLDKLNPEAKGDKDFYGYLVKIKDRFINLFDLEHIVDIEVEIKQMLKELKLFQGLKAKYAEPMFKFIENNWKSLFIYKKYPGKAIENTSNTCEIIFSLLKPLYKVMKHLRTPTTTQEYFEPFVLRHNFRIFQRGKRKGFSPIQLEGIRINVTDWTELIWGNRQDELFREIENLTIATGREPRYNKAWLSNGYAYAKN